MDKLSPGDQAKLQNILNYYTEYRKAHYDDNDGIAIENKRREEEQLKVQEELQKLKEARATEKYVALSNEKDNLYEQIDTYENIIYNDNDEATMELEKMNEAIAALYSSIVSIGHQQLEIIKAEGVNIQFLEDNCINVMTVLI